MCSSVGMYTTYRPGKAIWDVIRAPFCPSGSFAIWTMISWPSLRSSVMEGPSALGWPHHRTRNLRLANGGLAYSHGPRRSAAHFRVVLGFSRPAAPHFAAHTARQAMHVASAGLAHLRRKWLPGGLAGWTASLRPRSLPCFPTPGLIWSSANPAASTPSSPLHLLPRC